MGRLTFSGNGIAGGFRGLVSGSADSLCLTRFEAVGEEGSSVALRFPSAPLRLAISLTESPIKRRA